MPDGRTEGSPDSRQRPGTGNPAAVRVILADSQAIFRVGLRKVLAVEDDIRVVGQAETLAQTLAVVSKNPADILIFESQLCPSAADAATEILNLAPSLKIVLLTSDPDERETVDYLRRGIRGIVNHAVSPDLLIRCVRKVAAGETWLDKRAINWVIEAYRAQASALIDAPGAKWRLSDKERHIISAVAQGMRNKEIADQIHTTEQVVKNYLRKIYDKLGVSDRLELALYCIHHRLFEGEQPRNSNSAEGVDSAKLPVESH
ncbi:MAG: response regulator transcription factor [Thermomicrobiales bacterium]